MRNGIWQVPVDALVRDHHLDDKGKNIPSSPEVKNVLCVYSTLFL